ncbi:hypothetical protein ACFW04_010696 [Cataglyphis niger]
MTKNVWTVLSPLLIINYIFGLKIIELPIGHPRLWLSFLYILFSWSLYFFLIWYTTTSFTNRFSSLSSISQYLNYSTAMLSIVFGIYYDKKFKNCLKKLTVVDITLEKLEITINYQQLHKRIVRLVLGWFAIAILINYITMLFIEHSFKYNLATAIYFTFMFNHCYHINLIGDLTLISILGLV